MPDIKTPKPYACRHLFTDGHQSGSPALRGEALCYYHHASRRPQQHQTLHGNTFLALPEPLDLHAVQRGLAELLRLLAVNALPHKQASLMLRNLTTASQNLARIDRQTAAARKLNPNRAPVGDYTNHPILGTIAPAPLVPAEEIPTPPDAVNQQLSLGLLSLEPTPRPEGPLPDPASLFTPETSHHQPPLRPGRRRSRNPPRPHPRTHRPADPRPRRTPRPPRRRPTRHHSPAPRRPLQPRRPRPPRLLSQLAPRLAALEAHTPPNTHETPIPDFETHLQPNEDFGSLSQPPDTHAHPAFEYAEACA